MKAGSLVIDDEFKSLIPPLTDEEFRLLEDDIVTNGVRDSLIVWAGHNIIVDGHNRYRICLEYDIDFEVTEMEFPDRIAVIKWMRDNQLGRRNLSPGQKATLGIDASEAIYREEARRKEHENRLANLKQNQTHIRTGQLALPDCSSDNADDGSQRNRQTESFDIADNHSAMNESSEVIASLYQTDEPTETVCVPIESTEQETKRITKRIADDMGIGERTVKRAMAVKKSGHTDLYDKMRSGEMSANEAYTTAKKREAEIRSAEIEQGQAVLTVGSGVGQLVASDLLITEAPNDVSPECWLYQALSGIRHSGHAYVFVDPSPDNLVSYLSADVPMNVELEQVLVWSFDYLVGNNDRSRYKPSWKAILFYRGIEANDLRFPYIKERNAVHFVNAEGGELGKPGYELQMPYELAERLIKQSTNEGDLVFDPFAKRGTILLAAKKLGRDAIGYESDVLMAEKAYERGVTRG